MSRVYRLERVHIIINIYLPSTYTHIYYNIMCQPVKSVLLFYAGDTWEKMKNKKMAPVQKPSSAHNNIQPNRPLSPSRFH